ncbi:hypothetical protein KC926_04200 [Candidatus Kaiserbacteria bacterium]|nr:hypothetical protein [Candidatus Kaiserbacteria bacterium]
MSKEVCERPSVLLSRTESAIKGWVNEGRGEMAFIVKKLDCGKLAVRVVIGHKKRNTNCINNNPPLTNVQAEEIEQLLLRLATILNVPISETNRYKRVVTCTFSSDEDAPPKH